MYLRCSAESKPAWNGNNRVLFQNNANHSPADMSRSTCSGLTVEVFLESARQRKTATEAIAIRTIHNGQHFFIASSVRVPVVMELPGPGILAVLASAACRQEEPANDVSQPSSLRRLSWSAVKFSHRAGGPL